MDRAIYYIRHLEFVWDLLIGQKVALFASAANPKHSLNW
jgi:hypothetical protein